jgi:hypothetical protein
MFWRDAFVDIVLNVKMKFTSSAANFVRYVPSIRSTVYANAIFSFIYLKTVHL